MMFIGDTIGDGKRVPTKKAAKPKMGPKPNLPTITHRVFMDVKIEDGESKKIVFGLFGEIAPKTVENFRSLCACDKGLGKMSGKQLCYKDSIFHNIIPNFMIQGGDFTHANGVGGESIYGGKFNDENFQLKHDKLHLLSMSNSGPDTNGSQFFINTVKTSWLDNKHVIFGIVLEGKDVVTKIGSTVGTSSGKPRKKVTIVDTGELSSQ